MRILVLNQYFYPDRSATAQLLRELCDDLSHHHEVQVVAGRPSYNPARTPDVLPTPQSDVRVSRAWSTTFDRAWMLGRLTNYATYLSSSLATALNATRPDVVLAWTDPPLIGLVAALAARGRGVPFVLATQDIFPDVAIQLGRLKNPAVIRLLRLAARRQFSSAVRIVSLGRDMDHRLEALGIAKQKIRTISNWTDGSVVRPLSRSPMREAWGFGDSFVVMHSGNVGLSQSLETVIEAADLLRGWSDIVIAIVGEGAAKARLQADVMKRRLGNVRFLDYQPRDSLSESLAAADTHLVSLKRGLAGFIVPSKVYGIMAAGRPFIAAVEDGSEPALIVEEYGCGLRIEPDDPGALAEVILRMRDSSREEMGHRARRAFEQRFDRGIATTSYRKLLEEVVEEAHAE